MRRDSAIPSVWDVVPDDGDLYREVFQEHFSSTNLQVIALFKSLKIDNADKATSPERANRQQRGGRGKPSLSAHAYESLRILVITVDRTKSPPKASPELHKFGISFSSGKLLYHPRGAPLGLSMLKSIHILEPNSSNPMAINIVGTQWAAKPRSKAALPQLPEGFLQPTKTSTPFHYAFATGSRRVAFACVMFCVSRSFAEHKPGLNGISRDLVDAWATRTVAQRPSNIVPSAFERVAFSTEPMEAGQRAGDWAVLSERDAVHLSGLLDLINQTGNLDVGVLRKKLEEEHNAMEAANVQAILGSVAAVPTVLNAMQASSARIDDLDLTLDVFDGKLTSMREDIASIESRNNSLDAQARNLQTLKDALLQLLQTLSPSRAIRNLEHLQLKENSVLTAMVGLNDAKNLMKTLTPGEQVDLAGLRKECAKMRVVVEFKEALVGLCGAFLKRSQAHLCQVAKGGDLFVTSPNIALHKAPGLMPYAPLLHLLSGVDLKEADSVLKDVRATCMAAGAASISRIMRDACNAIEGLMQSQDSEDRNKVSLTMLRLLQVHLPPIAHALMYAADALAMRQGTAKDVSRAGGETDPGISGALTSSLTGAITKMVNTSNPSPQQNVPQTLVEKALAQAARTSASGAPTVSMRDLLKPAEPLSEHSLAMLGKMTNGGVRDGLIRVARAAGAKSYVPLVPLYAGIAGWRKHLSTFPALAALNAELKEVLLEVTSLLEKHQEALVTAAERQEQPKATFMGDGKSLKSLGILHLTEVLAQHAGEIAGLLDHGLDRQLWWLPWGEQAEIASVEALARKAHEAIGRVVTAVYNAVLANLSKLAARDTKHGAHFVLENLSAMQPRIALLASKVPDIRACRDDLQGNLARSRGKLVEEQMQASKLWTLLSFAGRLHVLLREVAPSEVQFQQGYAQASVASIIETGYSGMEGKIKAISQRVKKHLPHNPNLLKIVWGAVEETLVGTLSELEKDVRACYKGLKVPLPSQNIMALLKSNAPKAG